MTQDADSLPLLCNASEVTDDLVAANVPNGVAPVNESAETCGPGLFFNESLPGASDANASTSDRLDAGCQLCPAGTYKLGYGNEESACEPCRPATTTGSSNANRTQCLCAEAEGEQFDYVQDACVVRGPYRGLTCLEQLFEPAYAVVRGVRFAVLPNITLQLRTDPINFHRLYDDTHAAFSQSVRAAPCARPRPACLFGGQGGASHLDTPPLHAREMQLTSDQASGAETVDAPLPVRALPDEYFMGGRLYAEIRLERTFTGDGPALPAYLSSPSQRVFAEAAGYEEPPVERLSGGAVAGIVIGALFGASVIAAGVAWLLVIRPRRQAQQWQKERDARLARGDHPSLFDRASSLSSPHHE